MWNELTFLWNELTILWNDLTTDWNDLTWNDLTMERNDRIPELLAARTPDKRRRQRQVDALVTLKTVNIRIFLANIHPV